MLGNWWQHMTTLYLLDNAGLNAFERTLQPSAMHLSSELFQVDQLQCPQTCLNDIYPCWPLDAQESESESPLLPLFNYHDKLWPQHTLSLPGGTECCKHRQVSFSIFMADRTANTLPAETTSPTFTFTWRAWMDRYRHWAVAKRQKKVAHVLRMCTSYKVRWSARKDCRSLTHQTIINQSK